MNSITRAVFQTRNWNSSVFLMTPMCNDGERARGRSYQNIRRSGSQSDQKKEAIHRLQNKYVVIAKLVNRCDSLALLRNKKKLREFSPNGKRKLKSNNVYVNESLCSSYNNCILSKCNVLLKKKYTTLFYTINEKIRIT